MWYIFNMWVHCYLGMYPHCHHYYRNASTFSRHQVSQNVDVSTLSPLYRDVSTLAVYIEMYPHLARHLVSSSIDVSMNISLSIYGCIHTAWTRRKVLFCLGGNTDGIRVVRQNETVVRNGAKSPLTAIIGFP